MFSADNVSSNFSVAQQKVLISADLNSTLLLQFLFGIYTGVFPAAIYIYVHKENRTRASDRVIIGSTIALYLVTALTISMNWIYTNVLFGTRGGTRVETFKESAKMIIPLGEEIIADLILFVVYLLADGLLVWRCFHSCRRSFRRSFLPLALFIAEIVLALAATISRCMLDAVPDVATVQANRIVNRLNAGALVTVAATSLASTGMICLQIWEHTTPSSRSRKPYRTIINALIESSAIYTVFVLFEAVLQFINTGNLSVESSFKVLIISNFVSAVSQIISGLAPALMIARLFLSSGQEDAEDLSAHLPSDFVSRATHATTTNIMTDGAELEMQQRVSVRVGEQESEEIGVVRRAEYQPEAYEVEDRLRASV
ncbi:hypothetical protein CPC08DRAFT_823133 [Agrocybe pediades]|nr:hypothetical protein CPC08DRAFT_823133 [Agrocybe pediades]